MKIAVLGGGGVRTPLLANGLARSGLPIDEIALFDTDRDRLSAIAPLAVLYTSTVRAYDDARACVAEADFVVTSIRVGGIAARARDEAVAIEHGTIGQETVGAAGFAMAVRTIPDAVGYARLIAQHAPRAWVINFTNPVGIVTQAMTAGSSARVIGVCDTPTELFEDVANVLGVDSARCEFDYFGLNHLGWLRQVYCDGVPRLDRLWDEPALVDRIYRAPLFDTTFLATLRLLPTEYLFYYYRPDAAFRHTHLAGQTRGAAIAKLNDRLFQDLAAPGADRRRVYEAYLAARGAGYMQIELGGAARVKAPRHAGYDKIAVSVISAIHFNANTTIPVNVSNCGTLPDLEADDSVEVPCTVDAGGAHPRAVDPVPDAVRDLLVRVKDYERQTIVAATTRSRAAAVDALARNPLVGDPRLAERLVDALDVL